MRSLRPQYCSKLDFCAVQACGYGVVADAQGGGNLTVSELLKGECQHLTLCERQLSNGRVKAVSLADRRNNAVGGRTVVRDVHRWLGLSSSASYRLAQTHVVGNAQDVRLDAGLSAVSGQRSHNGQGDLLRELLPVRAGRRVAGNNAGEGRTVLGSNGVPVVHDLISTSRREHLSQLSEKSWESVTRVFIGRVSLGPGSGLYAQQLRCDVDADLIRHKLEMEIEEADWSLIAPHFARDVLVLCGDELELLDAAVALAKDDATAVGGWLASGALRKANDTDALAFAKSAPRFRFVIVAPFVVAHVIPAEAPEC